MSLISDRIKKYVSYNPKTGEYGSWGALRPDQRRDILELCRVCDVFEGAADYAFMELIPENKARVVDEILSEITEALDTEWFADIESELRLHHLLLQLRKKYTMIKQ